MSNNVVLRREGPADHAAVEKLQRIAFDDSDELPSLVLALRRSTGPLPTVSIVASEGGDVIGHVMLSAGRLDAPMRLVDVFVLSPLGVLPTHQGRGIGTRLISEALTAANEMEVPLVFLEGDPGYYGTRGFARADEQGFRSPSMRIPAPAFQVALLSAYEPWMTGTLVYSEIFWELDCVGLRDDDH
jgi:putative acetyltransferase